MPVDRTTLRVESDGRNLFALLGGRLIATRGRRGDWVTLDDGYVVEGSREHHHLTLKVFERDTRSK